MNAKPLIALIIVSLPLICSKAQTNVVPGTKPPKESPPEIFVERSTYQAFRPLELKHIAMDFAKQKNIDFDCTNAPCAIWVYTGGSSNIAKVIFGQPRSVGKQYYWAEINRSGNVVNHEVGVRSEQHGLP